jgi:N6-L-threonylcarbamoyladenine synthase
MMNHKKYILAIETSCDDTSIAISCNDRILSNVTLTTSKSHKQYGGIVPEIAARGHETDLSVCYRQALKQAKIRGKSITHVAYTATPGLPGSLHVGKVFAKSVASLLQVPLIPIDHMMGHIYSFAIGNEKVAKYPFLALVVSGGHTAIYFVKSIKEYQVLNQTTDDAMGETLDKVGRILKLDYPGGISIDKIYNARKTNLKMINHFKPEQSFSFSGIKTHILNYVNQSKMKNQKVDKVLVASSLLN